MWDKKEINQYFNKLLKLMRMNEWNIELEFIEYDWKNTGNVKVDMDAKSAIVYLNIFNPKYDNYQQVLIHELCHIKLWQLDQYCESLLDATFEDKDSRAYKFGYDQFMCALEQTTDELTKTFLPMLADDKQFSIDRCRIKMTFRETEGIDTEDIND